MEKLIYILWKDESEARADFAKRLLDKAGGALVGRDEACHVQLNVVDEAIRSGEHALMNNTKPRAYGLAQIWVNSARDREPLEEILEANCARIAGYLVTESMPIVNTEHKVPLGERTPGFSQFAFLKRPSRLAYEDWLDVWLNSHTQVAIDTQSTFLYVQNVIARGLTYSAPTFDAIVEEGFPEGALTELEVFYDAVGDADRLKKHQDEMMKSCARFVDFNHIDVTLTSQYVLK